MRVVYLDLLFALNAGMDLLLLALVGLAWRRRKRRTRLILAALFGGVWACLVTVNSQLSRPWFAPWFGTLLTWTAVSFLMVKVAFGSRGIRVFQEQMTLFAMTFVVGGAVDAVYYHSSLGTFVRNRVFHYESQSVSAVTLLAGVALGAAGISLGLRAWRSHLRAPDLRRVKLCFRGKTLELCALYDTGNRLKDPVFGRPVHVLELEAAGALLSAEECRFLAHFSETAECQAAFPMVHAIPYCSVGQDNGLMPAIFLDEMWLEGEELLRLERPLIGFSFHPLNQERQYQMILHPAALTEQNSETGEDRRL